MPFFFPKIRSPTLCLPVFTLPRLAQSHKLSTSLLPYIYLSKGVVLPCQTQNFMLSRTCVSRQESRDICKGQGSFTIEVFLSWPEQPQQMLEYGVATGQISPWWSSHKMFYMNLWCFERWLCLTSPANTRSPSGCHREAFWMQIPPPCACISALESNFYSPAKFS